MGIRGFCVERLGAGDWPSSDDEGSVIRVSDWMELHEPRSVLQGRPLFAFDVDPNRVWSSIAAAGHNQDGKPHLELPFRARGTDWVVPKLKQLKAEQNPVAIICDKASPARSLIPELEDAGIEVATLSASEHADACGKLVDAVNQKALCHLGSPEINAALRGAEEEERSAPALSFDDYLQILNQFSYNGVTYSYGSSPQEEIQNGFSNLARNAYKANGVVFACMLVRQLLFSEARPMFRQLRNGRPGDLFSHAGA
jgi:hypothetical protein